MDISTFHWKTCGWCGTRWNPPRPKGWLGLLICPSCEVYPRVILHRLIKFDIVRLRKKSKLPPKRKRRKDWGHLGEFDEKRPWLRWTRCEFCGIPQCMNNNENRRSSIEKWRGHVICGKCRRVIARMNKKLVKMKYLKIQEIK